MTPQATTQPIYIDLLTSSSEDQDRVPGGELILRPSRLVFPFQENGNFGAGRNRRIVVSKADNADYSNWSRIGESDPDRPAGTGDHCAFWPGRMWAGPSTVARADQYVYYAMRDGVNYIFYKMDVDTGDWTSIAASITVTADQSRVAWDKDDQLVFAWRDSTILYFSLYDQIGATWSAPTILVSGSGMSVPPGMQIFVTVDPTDHAVYNFFWRIFPSTFFNDATPGTMRWQHRAWLWNPLTSAYQLSAVTDIHTQTHIPFVGDILDDTRHYGGIDPETGRMVLPYDKFMPGTFNNTVHPHYLDLTLPYIDNAGSYVPPTITDVEVSDLSTQPILQGQGAANPDTQSAESCLVWDGGAIRQSWTQQASPPTNPDSTVLGQIYFASRVSGAWQTMEWFWDEPTNLPANAPPSPSTSDWFFNNIFFVNLPSNGMGATTTMFYYPDYVERFIWIISSKKRQGRAWVDDSYN